MDDEQNQALLDHHRQRARATRTDRERARLDEAVARLRDAHEQYIEAGLRVPSLAEWPRPELADAVAALAGIAVDVLGVSRYEILRQIVGEGWREERNAAERENLGRAWTSREEVASLSSIAPRARGAQVSSRLFK